jgi:hypothetical protein
MSSEIGHVFLYELMTFSIGGSTLSMGIHTLDVSNSNVNQYLTGVRQAESRKANSGD